jgi:NADH-quinone oxidoreductase subunit J
MNYYSILFYSFAALTVLSALVVVFARNMLYSAFALLFTFLGVAGLYLSLGADFLAGVQLLIYVGGILVLLLFGVMLTHKLYNLELKSEVRRFFPSILIAVFLFALLVRTAASTDWALGPGRRPLPTTVEIGHQFLGRFLLPFEAASVLLLVALMGAALIVRRRRDA